MARFMVDMSAFTQHWLWLVAAIVSGVIFIFYLSLSRFDGPLRIKLDRYVPYSIYRILQGSAWLMATAALVNAGQRNEAALDQQAAAASASPWLKTRLFATLAVMRTGKNMGDALRLTGYEFPDREIIEDLGVYASLSGFAEALEILGKEWLHESVEQIKEKMTIVFAASLLLMAVLIGLMITGMIDMQTQLTSLMQMGR